MTPIRVMSFNINGSDPSWPERLALNVNLLRRYSPDLIGMQEVGPANLSVYEHQLDGYYHVLGAEYGEDEDPGFAPIFWKQARFELIASGNFWLSRTPDVRSADWGVPYPMGATWAQLEDRQTGAHWLHLNTHFEDGPDGVLSRPESSNLMAQRAGELAPGLPVVATGDFNCNPWSPAYNIFIAAGFTDTYRAAGQADSAESSTFHAYQGRSYFSPEWGPELFWRVDWIMTHDGTRPVQTTCSGIVRDAEPPLYPSDHYPVVSEVVVL